MNLTALSTFWTVRQWPRYRRMTAEDIIAEINRIHAEAAQPEPVRYCSTACRNDGDARYCDECWRKSGARDLRRKVKALWRVEALGVCIAKNFTLGDGEPPYIEDMPVGVQSIVAVGIGAGCVARNGFDANVLLKIVSHARTDLQGYFWEGVGHMLALRYHPVVAWMLGMPRQRVDDRDWKWQFPSDIWNRISFGEDRMKYLCGRKDTSTKGARFARDILRLYGGEAVEPDSAALKFVNDTWPSVERWC